MKIFTFISTIVFCIILLYMVVSAFVTSSLQFPGDNKNRYAAIFAVRDSCLKDGGNVIAPSEASRQFAVYDCKTEHPGSNVLSRYQIFYKDQKWQWFKYN